MNLRSEYMGNGVFLQILPRLLAALLLIEFLFLAFVLGPRHSSDSLRDDRLSNLLIEVRFDLSAFGEQARIPEPRAQPYFDLEKIPQPQSPWLYFIWVALIAVMKLMLGNAWGSGVVAVNALALALSGFVTMSIVARITENAAAILIVGLVFAVFWDQFYFVYWIQSDTIFNLMAAAIIAICLASFVSNELGVRLAGLLAAAVLGLVATMFRPPGIVLLACVGTFALYGLVFWRRDFLSNQTVRVLWVLALGMLCLLAIMLEAYVIHDPSRWPFEAGRSTLGWLNMRTGAGEVVISRPETFLTPPETWWGVAAVGLAKFVYYFAFLGQDFSLLHSVVNIAWYIPFYALVLRGLAVVLLEKDGITPIARHIGLLAVTMILLFATFHAATLVDFEWRYRIPAYPAMTVLCAMGAMRLAHDWLFLRAVCIAKAHQVRHR